VCSLLEGGKAQGVKLKLNLCYFSLLLISISKYSQFTGAAATWELFYGDWYRTVVPCGTVKFDFLITVD
jgi:hypothetical protein